MTLWHLHSSTNFFMTSKQKVKVVKAMNKLINLVVNFKTIFIVGFDLASPKFPASDLLDLFWEFSSVWTISTLMAIWKCADWWKCSMIYTLSFLQFNCVSYYIIQIRKGKQLKNWNEIHIYFTVNSSLLLWLSFVLSLGICLC